MTQAKLLKALDTLPPGDLPLLFTELVAKADHTGALGECVKALGESRPLAFYELSTLLSE